MDVSGDVADLMVKESIQLTEASIKLLAAGGTFMGAGEGGQKAGRQGRYGPPAPGEQGAEGVPDQGERPCGVPGLCQEKRPLRKSEALGLRWSDIDFEAGTLTVQNTVTRMKTLIEHEQTKSAASKRVLYLMPDTITYLHQLQQQSENHQFLGDGYIISDHICIWPDGRPVSPDYDLSTSGRSWQRIISNPSASTTFATQQEVS